jgi:hypothetical protein
MKVNIEMDMTPEEARAFMGLPDIAPMQKKMLDEMQARMKSAFDANDPEGMMRAWLGQCFRHDQERWQIALPCRP